MKKILFYTLVILVLSSYIYSITPNDGYDDGNALNSSSLLVVWKVWFNVTSGEDGSYLNNLNNITCDYTGFIFDYDTTNPYGPYGFPPGEWQCTFKESGYYDRTKIFTADADKVVDVSISVRQDMTIEEHTWLEALYNCIILEDCSLWNILREINQTTGYIWQHIQPIDQSVLTTETISEVVNSTHNLTYDATVNVPIKQGYGLGDYLPIRIGYWFIDKDNASKCFSQGNPPSGIELIEPYCQPLMVQTMGPMGGSVKFRVDLRPNLTIGTYNITRRIEIDPNNVWIPYGHGVIGQIEVTEDSLVNPTIIVGDESYVTPDKEKETIIIREGSGGGGGGSKVVIDSKESSPITNIFQNITNIIVQEDKQESKDDKNNEEKASIKEENKPEKVGVDGLVTGAAIKIFSDITSNTGIIGILIVICLILGGFVIHYRAKSKKN